jgi:DNA-binding NarL/FixJ family response regulator
MAGPLASERVRVLIVDDQTLLRESFRRLLELEGDGLEVIGTAASGAEAISTIETLATRDRLPDVVLMDVRMPQLSGVEATREICQRWPRVRVMMLTTFDDEEFIVEGLRAGAKGYLLKDVSSGQLVDAIRAVQRGESPLQPSVAAKLVARLTHPEQDALPASTMPRAGEEAHASELTDRESEILRLVAQGKSNREIGEMLFITEGTVKNHVSSILTKLGLRDRTQAALWAREHGLL